MEVYKNRHGTYILPVDTVITKELVEAYIRDHEGMKKRYFDNERMYTGEHEIQSRQKTGGKPNNRLVVNFAKYIVDTLNGYFIGVPIKVSHENDDVSKFLQDFIKQNDLQDNEAEISKMCSIYGHAFEMLYQDEESDTRATYLNPIEGFMVYDDTIEECPLFFVRYYRDQERKMHGKFISRSEIRDLNNFSTAKPHHFGGVPVIEYVENEERQGAFENVKTLINALNKALSEKANDVDYFADAYLKIIGAEVDEDKLENMRESRTVNVSSTGGGDAGNVVVEFMEKPDADGTQEHLLDRLIDLIYQISMIANVSDDTFSSASSGTALEFKLQPMKNLALTKERKFQASMRRRWRLVFNIPTNSAGFTADSWVDIEYTFTRNIPQNTEAEANVLNALEGITSKETQLKTASFIDNPKEEIKRMQAEEKTLINTTIKQTEKLMSGEDND